MSARDTGELLSVTSTLNREGRSGVSSRNSERLRNHEWEGFRWNTGDENVSYWYPQGISGSSDAFAATTARKYVLVSWYNNSDERPTRGVRISSSSQVGSLGRLYRTRPGLDESRITAWVYGAEDLYVDRERDIIWTAAEHPGNRDVVGIPIRVP